MSIVERKRREKTYLYFQYYENGKKNEVYLGPAGDPNVWMNARDRLVDYRRKEIEDQIGEVDERIAGQLKMTRRRLSQLPEQVSQKELGEAIEDFSRRPGPVAFHPVLKDELDKLLLQLRKRTTEESRNIEGD